MNEDIPTGFIECDGELMAFWLPETVSPDDLDLQWMPSFM